MARPLAPYMATMLAVVATDIAAEAEVLQAALRGAVDRTFNRITVDGDMSTNDSVLLLATGRAPAASLAATGSQAEQFHLALETVCGELARQIVLDGEGATRLAAITVAGAASEQQAARVAQVVSRSLLVDMSPAGCEAAAEAILTTDTRTKAAAVEWLHDGQTVRLGGMAKGAGMIAPHMATMLAVVATDIAAEAEVLQATLRGAVDRTFNRITVDGDMSTNDSVLLLATGRAPAASLATTGSQAGKFQEALETVCGELARQIVLDGEGATRLAAITVAGAASEQQAARVAQVVSRSLLVDMSPAGCEAAAEAILTTDTRTKTAAVEWLHNGQTVRLGGMAKGAGMIAPHMATMLAVVATDIAAEAGDTDATRPGTASTMG